MKKILLILAGFLFSWPTYSQYGNNPFVAPRDRNAEVTFENPVIPGFYSDPSLCRVGDDFYLVTSTFRYFPGVPVFHSKDLVNWKQIGHCISRPDQLPKGLNIFACTIRYHEGVFYMITTNMAGGGNFYVTASDPAGPWSDPIWIEAIGIDPDLFFDDDGKAYVVTSTFVLNEIDILTGKFLSEGRKIWNGTGGRYAEAPHIYKKDGMYYLMASEGGTEEAHSATIAKCNSIWGPYYSNPSNPILTHCNAAGQSNPIQGVGHADMVQAKDGSYWMLLHGYRKVGGGTHHIAGRETMLAPVIWPKNGWPIINGNGTVSLKMTCPTLPLKPFPPESSLTDFDTGELGLEWNHLLYPDGENYSLSSKPGKLQLKGSELSFEDRLSSPTFVGRRIQNVTFTATTQLEFDPQGENEEAGLILLNNRSHFDLLIKKSNGKKVIISRMRFGSVIHDSEEIPLQAGPVKLRIEAKRAEFIFSFAQGEDTFTEIGRIEVRFLSSETVGWFTGVYAGLYASGNGKPCLATAEYDWFEYTD